MKYKLSHCTKYIESHINPINSNKYLTGGISDKQKAAAQFNGSRKDGLFLFAMSKSICLGTRDRPAPGLGF